MAATEGVSTYYFDAQGRFLASVRGATPVLTMEPYDAVFDWPLFVGKSWVNRYRMRDHERGRTWDSIVWDGEVKAYEEVTTPAGTFKAFKIVHGNPYAEVIRWYSPDLGIVVKMKGERYSTYYLGAGTRETELVSYDIKR